MKKNTLHSPLGMGLGLRAAYHQYILDNLPEVDWFEILTENYLVDGGNLLYFLDKIGEHYPLVMHGVSLSIGSSDPLNFDYLHQVKQLAHRIKPKWISDHLCWTGAHQQNMHDLLPLPYTEKMLNHIVGRIKIVQDFYQQPIVLENISSYISYKESDMTEWDFLTEIANQADCFILLDINNIYVNGFNHGFDPETYLNHIPIDSVQQCHLAGHLQCKDYIIDTHDRPISQDVWALYGKAIQRFGNVSTLIERDDNLPSFDELWQELDYAQTIKQQYLTK